MLVVFGAAVAGVLVEAFVPRAARRGIHLVLTFGGRAASGVHPAARIGAQRPDVNQIGIGEGCELRRGDKFAIAANGHTLGCTFFEVRVIRLPPEMGVLAQRRNRECHFADQHGHRRQHTHRIRSPFHRLLYSSFSRIHFTVIVSARWPVIT